MAVWAALIVIQVLAAIFAFKPVVIGAVLPLRLIVGTLATLVLPGALAANALGQRSRHFLETLAVSVAGSFVFVAAFGMAAMTFKWSMGAVVAALIGLNAALTFVCARRGSLQFLTVRYTGASDAVLAAILCGLALVAYRWGDDIKAVGWEVSLHLAYVREYASSLPLGFETAVLRPPDIIAQNYFYLWEFVLAGIARMAGIDPLVAALKSRWLMPTLSFASFFFMAQRLLGSTLSALRVTWVMVVAVLLQLLTLPPNPYEKYIDSGPLRQVGAFLGSIHHSDAAMEILLPALIGYLFWAIRRGTVQAWIGFVGALVIAFLWHPREYFQVMWYGVIVVMVDTVASIPGGFRAWRRRLANYAIMVACYAGVAGILYAGMPASIRASSEHIVGTSTQLESLRRVLLSMTQWRGWTSGSLPMSFHLHGYEVPGLPPGPPQSFSWLVLAIPAAGLLLFSSRRSVRWLALYLLVLWLVSLSSYKLEELLQAVTYQEMLISKPRMVHLFAYVVIGLGWTELMKIVVGQRLGVYAWLRASIGALAAGLAFALAWQASAPEFKTMITILNAAFFIVGALLIVSLWRRRDPGIAIRGRPTPALAAAAFSIFALPACFTPAVARWSIMLGHNLDPATLFSAENDIRLAPDTIHYFQTTQPPRTRLLVEPNSPHMVGVYAPVYVMPLLGNVGADAPQLQLGAQGKHPVFAEAPQRGALGLDSLREFLDDHAIQYILGSGKYVSAFLDLSNSRPDEFALKFLSRDRTNVLLEYHRPANFQ